MTWKAGNANGALYDLARPAVDANKPQHTGKEPIGEVLRKPEGK